VNRLDPRRHPIRPDLAAEHLRGAVEAARFSIGTPLQVAVSRAPLRGRPEPEDPQTTELLFGETFTVYEDTDGWAWGQNATDGYVGFVRRESLDSVLVAPTHRVAVERTFLFPRPDLKSVPLDLGLSLTSRVGVVETTNGFARLATGGFVFAKHLEPADTVRPDHAATALGLVGLPYLWGGRSSLGFDCSGLVQIALAAAGIAAPRDSDMQTAEVGMLVSEDGTGVSFERGDLVFFPGHVAIMIDAQSVVHATAFTLSVTVEPLAAVTARAGRITAVRRLPPRDR